MRICSLLPAATEMLFALGLGDEIVGVSHECVYPPEAARKPRIVTSRIDAESCRSDVIDQIVRTCLRDGEPLYQLDTRRLHELQPDLIVTQELCEVCAVDASLVHQAMATLAARPVIVSMHPHSVGEMLNDLRKLGEATGRTDEARRLVEHSCERFDRVRRLVGSASRPRVMCVEWLSPPMTAGHWVPEMVGLAGGHEVLGEPGGRSRRVSWAEIEAARPDILVLMPCGLSIARTLRELPDICAGVPEWPRIPAVARGAVYAVDGPSYFNQAGPRLIDGVELLAGVLHPERCGSLVPRHGVRRVT